MYQTVLKVSFGFGHRQELNLPGEKVSVLAVGVRKNKLAMWIETIGFVDTAQSTPVTVFVVKNGETYDDMVGSQYVGTVQEDDDDLHIYVKGAPLKRGTAVTDQEYRTVLELPAETLAHYRYLLKRTGRQLYDEFGLKRDETITHTAKFCNGYEADIKIVICEEEPPYIDAVLFDPCGNEVSCGGSDDDYVGEYWFIDHACNSYFVEVREVKKNRRCHNESKLQN